MKPTDVRPVGVDHGDGSVDGGPRACGDGMGGAGAPFTPVVAPGVAVRWWHAPSPVPRVRRG